MSEPEYMAVVNALRGDRPRPVGEIAKDLGWPERKVRKGIDNARRAGWIIDNVWGKGFFRARRRGDA